LNMKPLPRKQNGLVLLVSLLILLLIGVVATTVTETNIMQLRMAGNDESKTAALERALAVVDAILDRAKNTPVVGGIGYQVPKDSIVIHEEVTNAKGTFGYSVTRVGPLETTIPVMNQAMASSGTEYRAARFELTATYDGSAHNLGKATVVQGVLIKIAAGSQ
jgi:hypothetical protein